MANSSDKNSLDKLATKCFSPGRKIGASTIGHLISERDDAPNPQLDTITAVADAFKVEPWLLLMPEFDAKNPGNNQRMLALARRIAGLSKERQALLLDIFGDEDALNETNPSLRATTLHSPKASYNKKSAKP